MGSLDTCLKFEEDGEVIKKINSIRVDIGKSRRVYEGS